MLWKKLRFYGGHFLSEAQKVAEIKSDSFQLYTFSICISVAIIWRSLFDWKLKKIKNVNKKKQKKKSDFFFVKKCYSSDNMSKFGSQIKKHGHWAIDDYIHSSGAIPVWANSSNLFLLNKKSDFFFLIFFYWHFWFFYFK